MRKKEWESILDAAVSEIEYAIKTKHTKSEEVREFYLRNAIRFIKEAKEVAESATDALGKERGGSVMHPELPRYKAFNKKTGTMYDVEAINYYENTFSWIEDDYEQMEQTWYEEDITDDIVFIQSAVLNRLSGFNLYEGDIVDVTYSNKQGETYHYREAIRNPFDYSLAEAQHLLFSDEINYVGNIRENPELLRREI